MIRRSVVTLLLVMGLGALGACSPPAPGVIPFTWLQSVYNPLTAHHEGIYNFCALSDGWIEIFTGHPVYVQLTRPGGVVEGFTDRGPNQVWDNPYWQSPTPLAFGECFTVLLVDTQDQGPFGFSVSIEVT